MAEHTVKAFDEDITRLRGLIAEMGGLAEVALQDALEAMARGDETLGDKVVAGDKKIDALESEVDKLAVRIIALRAPMADDLREVIAALKIAGVVERIGDYSKNIARRVGQIEDRKRFEPLTLLPAMGELAGEMVHDVLTAYAAARMTPSEELAEAEHLTYTSSVDGIADCNFYIVTVPTPIGDGNRPHEARLRLADGP